VIQVHLKGKFHSGRAVRIKEMTAGEVEKNSRDSALVAGSGSILSVKQAEWRSGAKAFIVEYTKEPVEDVTAVGAEWVKASPLSFLEKFDKLFTAKDIAVLEQLFRDMHEVSEDAVNDILGKALTVSEG